MAPTERFRSSCLQRRPILWRRVQPYECNYYGCVPNGDEHSRFVCCSPSGSGNLVADYVGLRFAHPTLYYSSPLVTRPAASSQASAPAAAQPSYHAIFFFSIQALSNNITPFREPNIGQSIFPILFGYRSYKAFGNSPRQSFRRLSMKRCGRLPSLKYQTAFCR